MEEVFATGRPAVSDLQPGLVVRRPTIAIEVPVRRLDSALAITVPKPLAPSRRSSRSAARANQWLTIS